MEEKKRILKMVEEGKISSEDAISLLEALESSDVIVDEVVVEDDFFNFEKGKNGEKMLYIRVKSSSGDKVKVNVPLEFIKIMGGAIPNANLEKYDVDMDMLMKAIDSGFEGRIVEVESEDGDKVVIEIC